MRKGIFITFEGPEGAGKSTLIARTERFFRRRGKRVARLREPGGTKISEIIRRILLDKKNSGMTDETELFLYLAARAQIVGQAIEPALKRGKIVLCDRYHDSTVAYQGYGAGVDLKLISQLGNLAKRGIEPDLTILLDVDVKKGLKRGGRHDRIEKKSLDFHRRVRNGFLRIAKADRKRVRLLRDEAVIEKKFVKLEAILRDFMKRRKR